MGYTVEITNYLPGGIESLVRRKTNMAELAPVLGRAGRNCFFDHFIRRDNSKPNKNNYPRQHFWSSAARGVYYSVQADGVIIGVSKVGLRLLLEGGTVKAGKGISRATGKPTQFVTIPACAEAYGKRAGEFHNLKFVPFKTVAALVERRASQIVARGKGEKRHFRFIGETGGKVFFWLKREVVIEKDSSVIPSKEALLEALRKALRSHIQAKEDRSK